MVSAGVPGGLVTGVWPGAGVGDVGDEQAAKVSARAIGG
jgi:hypothetical protein